jgi:NitT/TauT family transport system substrate-binding protein
MMHWRPRLKPAWLAVLIGSMAAAFIGQAGAADLEHVTVRLDWLAGADHTALFLANARGYYKAAGLEVEIFDGKGSVGTLQAITAGNDTIGLANLSTMAVAVGKGAPLVAIADIVQKAPDGVIALKGSGITKPKDLEGRHWGFIPDDSGARLFPAFAAKTGINVDTIKKTQLSYSTVYSSLIDGNVDFTNGWVTVDALKVAKVKPIEPPLVYADYGVNMLGTGIFVTKTTLVTKADVLKRFLAATVHGAEDVQQDSNAAIDAVMAARPASDRAILTEELKLMQDYFHTPNSKGHVFGWMAPQDWQQTAELSQQYFGLPASIKTTDLYTNDLLPSQ